MRVAQMRACQGVAMRESRPAPRVSVIVPTHNRSHTLARALNSVLRQDFRDLELIVVDDASADDRPRQVVEAIAAQDPRVRYIRRAQNGGASATRNTGIQQACGEFVAFQDDDDEWLAGKLSRQVALMDALGTDCVLVGGSLLRHAPPANPKVYRWPLQGQTAWVEPTTFIEGYSAFLQTSMMRRAPVMALGGFDESIKTSEDFELCFRLLKQGRLAALHDVLTMSYEQAGSLSNQRGLRMHSNARIVELHGEQLRHYPRALGIAHYEIALNHQLAGSRLIAFRHWAQALRWDPRAYRVYMLLPMLFLGPRITAWGVGLMQKIKQRLGR